VDGRYWRQIATDEQSYEAHPDPIVRDLSITTIQSLQKCRQITGIGTTSVETRGVNMPPFQVCAAAQISEALIDIC
jgi:hypothetical protein